MLFACVPCLRAQDAPYRPALAQLRAALDSADTPAGIDRIATAWNATARPTKRLGDAYITLRRGIVANDGGLLQSSWDKFDQVVQVHPDWPYALMGLAIAGLEIQLRGYKVPGIYHGSVGLSHYEGAAYQFADLLKQEPGFTPALEWIANSLLTDEGDRAQPEALMQALGRAADSVPTADPKLQLIVARAERLEGEGQESIRRIHTYLRQGGDSGVGDFELARSLATVDSLAAGARVYLTGARVQTAPTRSIYRLDLSWIATPAELARYDSLPADSIGAYVARFWSMRDAREFSAPGGRLAEHLRRWAYVNEHFRIADPGLSRVIQEVHVPNPNEQCASGGPMSLEDYDFVKPASPDDYRAQERIFDHRAIVYMRHGEPLYIFGGDTASIASQATARGNLGSAESSAPNMGANDPMASRGSATGMGGVIIPRSQSTAPYLDRNVTWVYLLEGRLRAFTFMGHAALGTAHPTTLFVYQPPNLSVLLQLSTLSSSYARLANLTQANQSGTGGMTFLTCQQDYRNVVADQQEDAYVAVHTDTYLKRYAHPIGTAMQLAAVGQPALGTGQLVAAIGLRIEDLEETAAASDANRAAFVVRVRIAAIDSVTGEVVTTDTVRRFVAPRTLKGWMPFVATLPIARGYREARVSVQQGEDRGSTSAAAIEPAGKSFAASDLVLGTETGAATWLRNGASVPMSPFSHYASGTSVLVYQELYGLSAGGSYRTTLSLRSAGSSKAGVTLNFEDAAAGGTMSSSRLLALDRVKPGSYRLAVEVTEVATGRTVRRERAIEVTEP